MNKLIRYTLMLATLGSLTTLAYGDIAVADLSLEMTETAAHVHVALVNSDNYVTQEGPVKVTLFARPNSSSDWKVAMVWNDIPEMSAGREVTRNASSASSPVLGTVIGHPDWQAKIVVEMPKNVTFEKSVVYEDSASR